MGSSMSVHCEEEAVVESRLKFAAPSCSNGQPPPPLYLDGEDNLKLRSIALDGKKLQVGRDYVLGEEEGLTVRKFEVWHNTRNTELLRKLDPARCGGVPFFYNKESHRWICGATTYDNLKAWGAGTACDPFAPPPLTGEDKEKPEEPEEPEGGFGLFVSNLKKKAQEKMAERNAERNGEKVEK